MGSADRRVLDTRSSADTRLFPTGGVARVDSATDHRQFVREVRPSWVSIKLTHVRGIVENGETANTWFPADVGVITTSTINDDDLSTLSVEEERDLVNAFKPDVHVAGDVSAYPGMSDGVRADLIHNSMKNALWLADETRSETRCVPVIKGPTRDERELCYRALKHFDHSYAVLYASRYFTAGEGSNIYALVRDLKQIDRESNANIYALGVLDPQTIAKMPDCVVAAGGLYQWINRVDLGEPFLSGDARREWTTLASSVQHALERSPEGTVR